MEFFYLLRALWRQRWIILICTVVALVTATLFTKEAKKQYKSTAQLATGFTIPDLPNQGVNLPQAELKFNNAIENITSSKVLSLVSYHLMLHDLQAPDEAFTRLSAKSLVPYQKIDKQQTILLFSSYLDSMKVLNASDPQERILLRYCAAYAYNVEAILQDLQVARYQKTDYINITCTSFNPNLSAFIVNTICDEFKRSFGANKQQSSGRSVTTLDSLVKQKKAILDQKQAAKEQFQTNQGVSLDVNAESSNKLNQISTYESQLIDEKSKLEDLTYRVTQLNALIKAAEKKESTSSSANNSVIPTNKEYLRLRKQYNDLNNAFVAKGSNDATMKSRLDSISALMSSINLTEDSTAGVPQEKLYTVSPDQLKQQKLDAEAQLQAANLKISSIEAMLTQLRSGLSGMAAKAAVMQQLDKDIQIASADYTTAKDQLNVAMLNINSSASGNFKQTILGEPALAPEPSKRLIIIALAGVSAFILSSLIVILLAFFDQSIKSTREFQRLTNLRLLGTVNRVHFRRNDVLNKISLFENNKRNKVNIFREQLRKLRYEIEASNGHIFLFASTQARQGKTTLIETLAYSLSLLDRKILIIDTNFSNNDLTTAFEADTGFQKFHLNGNDFNKDYLKTYISKTSVKGVDIIGTEEGNYKPTEILHQDHLLNYLGYLKEEYDYIFLEGPPLNEFTDARELASYTDRIIAVFAADASLSAVDKESMLFFKEMNEKFLGAVLNKLDRINLET
jgi:uncharacterized protein involved in exopolysaccharide biosynthesis/Mrp family chromosome partitioning ATPase